MLKKENKLNLVEATKLALQEELTSKDVLSAGVYKLEQIVNTVKDIDVTETMVERLQDGSLHIMTTDKQDLCTIRGDYFDEDEMEDLRLDGYIYEEGKKIVEQDNQVDWGYYDRFEEINEKYLPDEGEGDTLATQIVTAINKLVYKWYNDGDVYDNVNSGMYRYGNNLSSYANWLAKYCEPASRILDSIFECNGSSTTYDYILKALADKCLNEDYLSTMDKPKEGSIYDCDGQFEFDDGWSDDEEY